ncbi:restriction endonuclease subunit S [Halomonas sp. BL6]|uniref:restriction endonuclease subunit S n=1 Tax=Halomonas sp. BL6 TaxID=2585770 RepID=UPI001117B051|nr:restriction endonuclease subunit S [Halomonas sp. BL6]TNH19754.1 restriction endonuclease subunit S [Halomonas sp. BL6]
MNIAAYSKYDSFKYSGFDWVGYIPVHWNVEKLGSMLSAVSEKNQPELPLLSITREQGVIKRNIEDQDSNHNFIPDDLGGYKVLRKGQFGMNKMKAWQGSYGVSAHTGIVSPAYFIFDFTREVDPHFFNIAIRSKLYVSYFGSASDGVRVGQWDLNQPRMRQIPLILPPLPEQRSIAAFLDNKCAKIDEAIRIKEAQITLLRERRQILIQQAVTCGLNPDVPMKDSGIDWIGEIPAHWNKRKLSHLGIVGNGSTPSRSNMAFWNAGNIPWLNSSKVNDFIIEGAEQFVTAKAKRECHLPSVKSGDLVMGITGQGKTRGMVAICKIDATINQHLAYIRVKSPDVLNYYLFHFFSASYDWLRSQSESSGSTKGAITCDDIKNYVVIVPSVLEQKAIVTHVENETRKIVKAISIKQDQIGTLKEYKTTLINAAVTGKIKVS